MCVCVCMCVYRGGGVVDDNFEVFVLISDLKHALLSLIRTILARDF